MLRTARNFFGTMESLFIHASSKRNTIFETYQKEPYPGKQVVRLKAVVLTALKLKLEAILVTLNEIGDSRDRRSSDASLLERLMGSISFHSESSAKKVGGTSDELSSISFCYEFEAIPVLCSLSRLFIHKMTTLMNTLFPFI